MREAAERLRLVPAGAHVSRAGAGGARRRARRWASRSSFEGTRRRRAAGRARARRGSAARCCRSCATPSPTASRREAERIGRGKPAEGSVDARGRAARPVASSFVCSDDGRGVDLDAVRRVAAAQRAARPPGRSATRRRASCSSLLLRGGHQHLAARDRGVRAAASAWTSCATRPSASAERSRVRTRPGAGTTVELVVPLSLASLDALSSRSAGARSPSRSTRSADARRALDATIVARPASGDVDRSTTGR